MVTEEQKPTFQVLLEEFRNSHPELTEAVAGVTDISPEPTVPAAVHLAEIAILGNHIAKLEDDLDELDNDYRAAMAELEDSETSDSAARSELDIYRDMLKDFDVRTAAIKDHDDTCFRRMVAAERENEDLRGKLERALHPKIIVPEPTKVIAKSLKRPAPRPSPVATLIGRRAVSTRLRFLVLQRCNFKCIYCGRDSSEIPIHVDHVHPVSAGGATVEENLVAACRECNAGKGTLTGVEPPS